jgi:hypothetical protein
MSNNENATESSFRAINVGDEFRIVNENFAPRRVMPTRFTKLSDTTYSYKQRPPRPDVQQSLKSANDDFAVVVVSTSAKSGR